MTSSPLDVPCMCLFLTFLLTNDSGKFPLMASLYARGDSLWVKYKSDDGTWKRKPTGYRQSNPGDRKQAQKLREALNAERANASASPRFRLGLGDRMD
jgi:hypothetical protein